MTSPRKLLNSFLYKEALDVEPGGLPSRLVASTLGRIGGLPNLILTGRALHNPQYGDRPKAHKETADLMQSVRPEALKDTVLRLGGTNLIDDLVWKKERGESLPWYKQIGGRVMHNPRTSILGKMIGIPRSLIAAGVTPLVRGSHYNPESDVAVNYMDEQPVTEHELGHAIDFNTIAGQPSTKKGLKGFGERQVTGLGRDLYGMSYGIPAATLWHEGAANVRSSNALQEALKNKPEEWRKRQIRRWETLPAGYGAYVAGALDPTGASSLAGLGIGKVFGLNVGGAMRKYDKEQARKPRDGDGDGMVNDGEKNEKKNKEAQAPGTPIKGRPGLYHTQNKPMMLIRPGASGVHPSAFATINDFSAAKRPEGGPAPRVAPEQGPMPQALPEAAPMPRQVAKPVVSTAKPMPDVPQGFTSPQSPQNQLPASFMKNPRLPGIFGKAGTVPAGLLGTQKTAQTPDIIQRALSYAEDILMKEAAEPLIQSLDSALSEAKRKAKKRKTLGPVEALKAAATPTMSREHEQRRQVLLQQARQNNNYHEVARLQQLTDPMQLEQGATGTTYGSGADMSTGIDIVNDPTPVTTQVPGMQGVQSQATAKPVPTTPAQTPPTAPAPKPTVQPKVTSQPKSPAANFFSFSKPQVFGTGSKQPMHTNAPAKDTNGKTIPKSGSMKTATPGHRDDA